MTPTEDSHLTSSFILTNWTTTGASSWIPAPWSAGRTWRTRWTRPASPLVAILGSHTHIDHMGSHAYFQKTQGTQVVMSLGEAGQIFSPLGLQPQYNNFPMAPLPGLSRAWHRPLVPDRVILLGREAVTLFGATFGILRTPATPWTTSACAPPMTSSTWPTP